ncbi:MAG: hypothetical protein ACRDOE_19415, partial [Streptosporangiaceae bacterium]
MAAPGLEVTGRIRELKSVPRGRRLAAILTGDLTPLDEPVIEFDTLVLGDGQRVPLKTSVSPGSGTTVRFEGGKGKQGRVARAKAMARQQIDARKRAVIDAVKAPGKMRRLGDALLARLPYHPQWMPAGTRFNAKLLEPVEFGTGTAPESEFEESGPPAAADSVVHARLETALDSRTARKGMAVEAVLTQPLFSPGHRLVFPEGSRMDGDVVQSKAARYWHRNGQLRFLCHGIEPPKSVASAGRARRVEPVEGRLDSVEVGKNKDKVAMDAEGGTKTVASKKRFIAPAAAMLLAGRGMDNDPVRSHGIPTGAHQANPGGRALAGGVGLGLIGAALGQISRPFAATLGFCGAARSIYTNLVARGQEVKFPRDTPVEIRLGSRTSAA